MQRPSADEVPRKLPKYFDMVTGGAYLELLDKTRKDTVRFFEVKYEGKTLTTAYAPGKWTIKELLMHRD
jgi:hypothetical protein